MENLAGGQGYTFHDDIGAMDFSASSGVGEGALPGGLHHPGFASTPVFPTQDNRAVFDMSRIPISYGQSMFPGVPFNPIAAQRSAMAPNSLPSISSFGEVGFLTPASLAPAQEALAHMKGGSLPSFSTIINSSHPSLDTKTYLNSSVGLGTTTSTHVYSSHGLQGKSSSHLSRPQPSPLSSPSPTQTPSAFFSGQGGMAHPSVIQSHPHHSKGGGSMGMLGTSRQVGGGGPRQSPGVPPGTASPKYGPTPSPGAAQFHHSSPQSQYGGAGLAEGQVHSPGIFQQPEAHPRLEDYGGRMPGGMAGDPQSVPYKMDAVQRPASEPPAMVPKSHHFPYDRERAFADQAKEGGIGGFDVNCSVSGGSQTQRYSHALSNSMRSHQDVSSVNSSHHSAPYAPQRMSTEMQTYPMKPSRRFIKPHSRLPPPSSRFRFVMKGHLDWSENGMKSVQTQCADSDIAIPKIRLKKTLANQKSWTHADRWDSRRNSGGDSAGEVTWERANPEVTNGFGERQGPSTGPRPRLEQDSQLQGLRHLVDASLGQHMDSSQDSTLQDVKPIPDQTFKSKTVISPSFSQAAAKAVMTTTVANNATIIKVSIMSNNTCSTSGTETTNSQTAQGGIPTSVPHATESLPPMAMSHSMEMGGLGPMSLADTKPPIIGDDEVTTSEEYERLQNERRAYKQRAEAERMEVNIRIDDSQCVQHGDQKRWQCQMCPKSYTTKHNLVTHILDHQGIKPHLCMTCGKYFKQLSHLNTHLLTHDNVKPHQCRICYKSFTQISHLKRHLTVHQTNRPHICDICNRGFAFPGELRLHRAKHAAGRIRMRSSSNHHLPMEEASTNSQVTEGNTESQGSEEKTSCPHCSKTFRFPSQLKDHLVSHSGSRPYMCVECGTDFMKEHHLKAHQFTHTGLKPYPCHVCGRAFNQKANMIRHSLIHSNTRLFRCRICPKAFTQPQTLKAHMVVHASRKPYQCNTCGKEFGRLHNLQGHMHMHNDSKPHMCFCGSRFTLRGNLNRHKKVKHGLNESTESMEEDAINFLNNRSRMDAHPHGEFDFDSTEASLVDPNTDSNLDPAFLSKVQGRKQRKSTPRKILRDPNSPNGEHGGSQEEDYEEEEEEEEDEKETSSQYFQPLNSSNNLQAPPMPGRLRKRVVQQEQMQQPLPEEMGRRTTRAKIPRAAPSYLEEDEDSDSDRDEGALEIADDAEWLPCQQRPRRSSKGAKLNSIIEEKFKSQ